MSKTEIIYKELSYKVVGCAMEVHKLLGILINFGETSLKYERIAF